MIFWNALTLTIFAVLFFVVQVKLVRAAKYAILNDDPDWEIMMDRAVFFQGVAAGLTFSAIVSGLFLLQT